MAHTPEEEIIRRFEEARKLVSLGALYFHYKQPDKYYVVESISIDEELEQPRINYRALYGKGLLWSRLLSVFLSKVELEDGKKVPRFQKVP